ncbi:hypothetical protein GGX14DRAFT_386637 [Mycena pura]|uniref:Uncharacterized protein n=1 Tax=Mycena pura TaxID=153505 RepID=A0AAD6YQ31_9AGAR|nr:hypothetical protein GGX14DRAFT_386637 [Mycena pura]
MPPKRAASTVVFSTHLPTGRTAGTTPPAPNPAAVATTTAWVTPTGSRNRDKTLYCYEVTRALRGTRDVPSNLNYVDLATLNRLGILGSIQDHRIVGYEKNSSSIYCQLRDHDHMAVRTCPMQVGFIESSTVLWFQRNEPSSDAIPTQSMGRFPHMSGTSGCTP